MKNLRKIDFKFKNFLEPEELIHLKGGTESDPCWVCKCDEGVGTWYDRQATKEIAEQKGRDAHYCLNDLLSCSAAGSPGMCLS
jgi:hypothetical protein